MFKSCWCGFATKVIQSFIADSTHHFLVTTEKELLLVVLLGSGSGKEKEEQGGETGFLITHMITKTLCEIHTYICI